MKGNYSLALVVHQSLLVKTRLGRVERDEIIIEEEYWREIVKTRLGRVESICKV